MLKNRAKSISGGDVSRESETGGRADGQSGAGVEDFDDDNDIRRISGIASASAPIARPA